MLSVNLRWFLELQVLLVGPASNVHTHPCASDLSVSLFPDYPASFWLFHLHFGRYYFHCWIVLLVVIRDFSCVGNLVHCSTIWWLEYSSLHHTNICLPGIFVYLSSPIPDTHLEKKKNLRLLLAPWRSQSWSKWELFSPGKLSAFPQLFPLHGFIFKLSLSCLPSLNVYTCTPYHVWSLDQDAADKVLGSPGPC